MKPGNRDWRSYVAEFHALRPGITERVLAGARYAGVDPYGWVVDGLPATGSFLELACGTAPLARRTRGARWIGADHSPRELAAACQRGLTPLVCADAGQLPFRTGAFDAVACTMALQVIDPLDGALGEIRRVLRSGGVLVALLPTNRPLTMLDRFRYTRLSVVLRRRICYPNDGLLARPARLLRRAGLTIVADEHRRFLHAVDDPDLFVRSLYLPGVAPDRVDAATRALKQWTGHAIGVPLRRLVAQAL